MRESCYGSYADTAYRDVCRSVRCAASAPRPCLVPGASRSRPFQTRLLARPSSARTSSRHYVSAAARPPFARRSFRRQLFDRPTKGAPQRDDPRVERVELVAVEVQGSLAADDCQTTPRAIVPAGKPGMEEIGRRKQPPMASQSLSRRVDGCIERQRATCVCS